MANSAGHAVSDLLRTRQNVGARPSPRRALDSGALISKARIVNVRSGVSGFEGYDVQIVLDNGGLDTNVTYEAVFAYPGSSALVVDDDVLLVFVSEDDSDPFVLAPGVGGGGGATTLIAIQQVLGFVSP